MMNLVTTTEAVAVLKELVGEAAPGWTAGDGEYVTPEGALGRYLAVDCSADRAQPPFNRAAMDGIAVPAGAAVRAGRIFRQVGVLGAGGDPRRFADSEVSGAGDRCIEIMTGAAVPAGYGTVVPYEDLKREERKGETFFAVVSGTYRGGENIHGRGADYPAGTLLLPAGTRITAPHLAVLASCGMAPVPVRRRPSIAILGTGDELVPVKGVPLDHQIRASNPWCIAGELSAWGVPADSRGIVGDDPAELRAALEAALGKHHIVLVSGAVSRGLFDAVPDLLRELGVEIRVHGVRQRPGKPLLLGSRRDPAGGAGTVVMGLPGNPVSSLVAVRRYLVPLLGESRFGAGGIAVETTEEIDFTAPLTWFPAVDLVEPGPMDAGPAPAEGLTAGGDTVKVRLRNGNGSGDFFHLAGSAGFIEVPEDRRRLPAGVTVRFFPWGG
jgi:molybdopterin molybdotransferase